MLTCAYTHANTHARASTGTTRNTISAVWMYVVQIYVLRNGNILFSTNCVTQFFIFLTIVWHNYDDETLTFPPHYRIYVSTNGILE